MARSTCPIVAVPAGRGDPLFSFDHTQKVFTRIAAPAKVLVVFDADLPPSVQRMPATLSSVGSPRSLRALMPDGQAWTPQCVTPPCTATSSGAPTMERSRFDDGVRTRMLRRGSGLDTCGLSDMEWGDHTGRPVLDFRGCPVRAWAGRDRPHQTRRGAGSTHHC